jgi:hypothetical protein
MSAKDDPQRWLQGGEGAPAELAALVRADESAGPDAAQLARMLGGIAAQVGRPELAQATPSAAAHGSTASTSALAGLAPYLAGAGLLALIAVGWLATRGNAPERSAVVQPAPAKTAAPVAMPTAVPAAPIAAPSAPAAVPTVRPAAAPQLNREQRPAHARIATRAVRDGVPADDAVAELALLERAQRALRSDPAAALALAEQHRAQYARGSLAQEREVLAIEALLRLGKRAAAERRAHAFEQRYPESSHVLRVRDLLRSTP